jgi:hypothetical protein
MFCHDFVFVMLAQQTLSGREKHQLSIIDERKSAVAEIAKDWYEFNFLHEILPASLN